MDTISDITLEIIAKAVWERTDDGVKLLRIDVQDCVLIAPAAAGALLGAPAGETVH